MRLPPWKVGELARRTGISIGTLHYYDKIRLLSPPGPTPSGHRLYTVSDVARLQQIVSLRALGFPLDVIRDWLDRPDFSAQRVIAMHVAHLREQAARHERLCVRLEEIATRLGSSGEISPEDYA